MILTSVKAEILVYTDYTYSRSTLYTHEHLMCYTELRDNSYFKYSE